MTPVFATGVRSATLKCQHCKNAVSLDDCTGDVFCDSSTEDCYMEQRITDALQVEYNSGCRSKEVCNGHAIGRRFDLISCERCCSTDRCNGHMCGIPAGADVLPVSGGSGTLKCHRCLNAQSLNNCTSIACDSSTEDCYMDEILTDQLEIVYNGGCRSKRVCSASHLLGRRNPLHVCTRCCSSEHCNGNLCGIPGGKTT